MLSHKYQIIILSAVNYTHILRGRVGALTDELLKLGYSVVFVEPPISLFRYISDKTFHTIGFLNYLSNKYRHKLNSCDGNLTVIHHLPILPFGGYSRLIRTLNILILKFQFQMIFNTKYLTKNLIFIASNPWWSQLINEWKKKWPSCYGIFCYDCIDDVSVFSNSQFKYKLYKKWHLQLAQNADIIFVSSLILKNEILSMKLGSCVYYVPNAVDAEWFKQKVGKTAPSELQGIKRPIIGFVGSLAYWINIDLLYSTAIELTDFSFVLVGPVSTRGTKKLFSLPNVHIIRSVSYSEVPSFINSFDVCLLPFKVDKIGSAADPLKTYEYLALGKPVVATDIFELQKFKNLIYISKDKKEFIDNICKAVNENSELKGLRIKYACENSWVSRVKNMLNCIEIGIKE